MFLYMKKFNFEKFSSKTIVFTIVILTSVGVGVFFRDLIDSEKKEGKFDAEKFHKEMSQNPWKK